MPIKVAINGFGRIGRHMLRAYFKSPAAQKAFEVVAVNDLTDSKTLAYLFKYDSVHGKFGGTVEAGEGFLKINGRQVKVLAEKDPVKLPWKDLGVSIVIESTGFFADKEGAMKHVQAGAKKVVVSAPAKGVDATLVFGVNADKYDPAKHTVVSMGSCTTNSLAPLVKVLNDNFGISKGFMTTVHAYTNDQRILDLPHKDLRRARAAAVSTIPTTTGAAKAISEVIPEMAGKLDGIALRVPIPDGSITDFTCELAKEATKEEINAALKAAADGPLKGIMEYVTDPIVSIDIIGNPHTAIIDSSLTMVIGGRGNFAKVFSWYDNEWGFSSKMIDLVALMASKETA